MDTRIPVKSLSVILMFLYMILGFWAQAQKCLANSANDSIIEENANPKFSAKIRQTVYLPVVVHILHNENIQNISESQIKAQIERVNEDFSKLNADFVNTPSIFQQVAADVEIQFCLATVDPQGNTSNGITRTETSVPEIGLTEFYYLTNKGGKSAWDNEKYINIWVADLGDSEILGFATFPGEAAPEGKDGVLINYRYFGNQGSHMEAPHELGRALTHEMGHYFGLFHTWGELNDDCNSDDGCEDTPLQDGPTFGCPSFPNPDICTQNNGIMFMNYMDYSDDACLTMFTQDQKDIMWTSLQDERSVLLDQSHSSCTVSNSSTTFIAKNCHFFPNPATTGITIIYSQFLKDQSLKIYDVTGDLVFKTDVGSSPYYLQLHDLETGIYYLSFQYELKKLVIID